MKFLEYKISAKNLTVRSTLKNRESLNELLCEVDLAVMPARTDGFGVTGLEALSAGLPVLVSPNTGFGEALIKVPFGSHFVIDSGDACDDAQVVQEWAKMIKKLKGKDRSQRLEEFEALRNFYEKKYSWEKQSKEVIREMVKMFQDASIGCQSSTQHRTSQETEGPEGMDERRSGSLPVNFKLKSAIFQEGKSGDPECLMHEMKTNFVNPTRTLGNLAKTLYGYLTKTRDLEVAHVTERSLRVTVKCKTLEVLEGLWKDYRSGNLNAEAEKRLLTDDIKREFHVVSVKLQTTIRIVDYLACKLFLTSFPQSDEDQTTDETQTQLVEEPEPVTQHADVKCSTDTKALAPGGFNQLQTEENELQLTKKQINEQQGQEEQLTQEQNPATKVQIHFETENKQPETMREQLDERQERELLRQEQIPVTELRSQLRTMKEELETTRKELNEYQGQEQLLKEQQRVHHNLQILFNANQRNLIETRILLIKYKEQVHRLQSQLRTREQDLDTTKKRPREQKEQERLLKEKQQQIYELQEQLSEQEQEHVHELESQLQTREQDLEATARRLREYEEQVRELHVRLGARKQDLEATKTRVREYQEQGELLKEQKLPYKLQQKLSEQQQEHVNELQSQLRTRVQDLEASEIRLIEYQEQVHELQQKLESKIWKHRVKRESETKSETTKEVYRHRELLRQQQPRGHQEESLLRGREKELETTTERQKRLLQPLKQREQGVSQFQSQLQTKYPRNWIIHRDEIQFDTSLLLSKGAWGLVYRGRFRGRDVAVKQMLPVRLPDDTRGFFERQADIASKCHHPCLLEFIGATADDQPPLFVTELMEHDCSLKTRLHLEYQRVHLSLTEEDVFVISLDVAQALNYLHQKPLPIIHHNISSGKVLLWQRNEQWRAKVSGYETMNFVRKSSVNEVRYRAPELLTKDPPQPISCKVDVYSFGVLLCEMSIRQEPDPQERKMQIAQIINRHFRELVQHCVKEEPDGRPNMEEVIEDLRTLISLHHPKLLLKLGK